MLKVVGYESQGESPARRRSRREHVENPVVRQGEFHRAFLGDV